MQTIKIKRTTDPHYTAGAIAKAVRSTYPEVAVEVRAVGHAAVYQMVRALKLATSYLAADEPTRKLTFSVDEEVKPDELDASRDITSTIFTLVWSS
jgi:stage V sporulation protein SpoVS